MVTNEKLLSSFLVGVDRGEGGQTVLVHNINVRSKSVVFNQIQDHLQQDKGHHKPNNQCYSYPNYMCLFSWCQMNKYN